MKKSILNLSFIAILTILFSSCGSISITQKRYSNGLNIDWFAAKDKKQDNQPVVKTRKAKSNPSNTIASINENESTVEADLNETIAAENIEFSKTFPENHQPFNAISNNKQTHKKALKILKNSINDDINVLSKEEKTEVAKNIKLQKKKNNKTKKTNDVPLILLVILALFPILSLIAVYLHQGEINMHFWITLLLHFIILYWLYALLVVLDVI